MATKPEDNKKPFRVVTTDGTFVKGYMTLDEATASANERNRNAETLGVTARYVGEVNPNA